MHVSHSCPTCGTSLPSAMRKEFCPVCTLQGALAPESVPPPPLHQVGDYELVEELARGGAGVVFRARQASLGRQVAVKLLLAGQFANAATRQRFQTEAAAAASLRHPNIVTIHEVGEHEGQPWLAMELMEGGTLADRVGNGPMKPHEAAAMVAKVAQAVQVAHDAHILHRDLKPSNVLLDSFGEPRVTDFGLAKLLSTDSEITLSGQVLGSPSFMAPEQAAGRNTDVDARTDIYSLGAILYQLLTARPPFQSDSTAATLRLVETVEPVQLRRLNPNVPADLEHIALKCLEKNPAQRYATAADLAGDLQRHLDGQPVRARPVNAFVRAVRWSRRHRAASLAMLLLVLLAAGASLAAMLIRLAEQDALNNLRAAEQLTYVRDLALADRAIEDGELGRTRDLLSRHLPRAGEPDLRTVEWYLLWQHSRSAATEALRGHEHVVSSLVLLPDGRLASGSWDGTVRLWDVTNQTQVAVITNYTGRIWGLDANTEKNRLLIQGEGGLMIYNLTAEKPEWHISGNYGYGNARFLPGGERFVVGTRNGTEVWPINSDPKVIKLERAAGPVAVSPDGKTLATRYGTALRLWNAAALELKSESVINGMNSFSLRDLTFSPDGSRIALASWDGDVGWLPTDAPFATNLVMHSRARKAPIPHLGWVADLAYSPDGKQLASVAADHQVLVWNTERTNSYRLFRGHEHEVWAALWLPDGNTLITAGKDETIRFWNLTNRVPSRVLRWRNVRALWNDSEFISVTTHTNEPATRLALLDWRQRRQTREVTLPGLEQASGYFFHPPGGLAGFGNTNGEVAIYDLRSDPPALRTKLMIEGQFLEATVSPDGQRCATVSTVGDVIVWQLAGGRKVHALPAAGRVIALNHDFLVTLPNAISPRVYGVRTGKALADLVGHKEDVSAAVLLPDGETVATSAWDGMLRLWRLPDGKFIETHRLQRSGIYALALSPDGKTLAAGGQDGVTRFWNIAARQETIRWIEQRIISSLWFTPSNDAVVINTGADVRVVQAPLVDGETVHGNDW